MATVAQITGETAAGRPSTRWTEIVALAEHLMRALDTRVPESQWLPHIDKAREGNARTPGRNAFKRALLHLATCPAAPDAVRTICTTFRARYIVPNTTLAPNATCECCKRVALQVAAVDEHETEAGDDVPVPTQPTVVDTASASAGAVSLFKFGLFDRSYIGRRIAGVVPNATAFNRLYLNEGSTYLARPLRIHVTLDRAVVCARGLPARFAIRLCRGPHTTLALVRVDTHERTVVAERGDVVSDTRGTARNIFDGSAFRYACAQVSAKPFSARTLMSYVDERDIHVQFNWPFRNKREVQHWLDEISAVNTPAATRDLHHLFTLGVLVRVTADDDPTTVFDERVLPLYVHRNSLSPPWFSETNSSSSSRSAYGDAPLRLPAPDE